MNSRTRSLKGIWILLCATAVMAGEAEVPLLVTVDDLPLAQGSLYPERSDRERITGELLAALERHGIAAVGLVAWGNVSGEDDLRLLERWIEAGHELGNHSYRHLSLTRTDVASYIADIEAAREKLVEFLAPRGRSLRFFRYPMLHEGDTEQKMDAVRAHLRETGQRPLPVTLDSSEYELNGPWVEARRRGDEAGMMRQAETYHEVIHVAVRSQEALSRELFGRAVPQILLLHANAISAREWDRLFTWLKERGFRFADVDEALADPVFAEAPRWIGSHGPGLWQRIASLRWQEEARAAIRGLLDTQREAWNRGDLEAFTDVYADDALFVSPNGTTRGRADVLAAYRSRYPDAVAMGRLDLEVIEIRLAEGIERSVTGDSRPSRVHGATVIARWRLLTADEDGDERSGLTMLAFAPTEKGWRIVQDASF